MGCFCTDCFFDATETEFGLQNTGTTSNSSWLPKSPSSTLVGACLSLVARDLSVNRSLRSFWGRVQRLTTFICWWEQRRVKMFNKDWKIRLNCRWAITHFVLTLWVGRKEFASKGQHIAIRRDPVRSTRLKFFRRPLDLQSFFNIYR